jgi:hypothetical protein
VRSSASLGDVVTGRETVLNKITKQSFSAIYDRVKFDLQPDSVWKFAENPYQMNHPDFIATGEAMARFFLDNTSVYHR